MAGENPDVPRDAKSGFAPVFGPDDLGFGGVSSVLLFGGTFDPVHTGHLLITERAMEFCGAGLAVFLPSCSPPHKNRAPTAPRASFEHRLGMAVIAAEGNPSFAVSDVEAKREGPSYTVDLLRGIRAARPDLQVIFLIGADWVSRLSGWKEIADVFDLCRILVAPRPGYSRSDVGIAARSLGPELAGRLTRNWVPAPEIGISSTEIRERLGSGLPVRYMLPAGVEAYIRANGLYAGTSQPKKQ